MGELTFEVDNVITSYGKFRISNVSFKLKEGDILGLIGRSGSGKSTLMRTLLGLKKPESGSVKAYINNSVVPLKKVVGYSPQDNALYPFMTVEENMMTLGELYNVKKSTIKERTNFLLKRFDLDKSRHKKITDLSGGMQKRADLAVSLVHSPQIIFLDEPFTGLDVSLQSFIWNLMKELSAQGSIIIISSHMLNDIQKNCNQFGLVENGIFYNTKQVIKAIGQTKEKSLEIFLEKLFAQNSSGGN